MTGPLNYRHLHCFWVVAQAGGMARGAAQLGLAVQTVSAQVRDLERALGVALLKPAGRGLTLTEANLVVYYANDFNLETRIQSEDRAHRIGQRNPVTYVDLISEGTIDEKIVAALRAKIEIGAKVLGEEAREWLSLKPSRP